MLEAGGLDRLLADPKAIKEAVVFAAATGGLRVQAGCCSCVADPKAIKEAVVFAAATDGLIQVWARPVAIKEAAATGAGGCRRHVQTRFFELVQTRSLCLDLQLCRLTAEKVLVRALLLLFSILT
jgi:hypothetical protein